MKRIKHTLLTDYVDSIASLCVLLGKNCVEYLDYAVIERLYQFSEEDNPYRGRN